MQIPPYQCQATLTNQRRPKSYWWWSGTLIAINLSSVSMWLPDWSLDPTKRNIFNLVGKFYDPVGILAPVVVKFKMVLQTMCEAKLEWDQPLPTDLLSKWQKLSAGLLEAQTIQILQCCTKQVEGEVISYVFCRFVMLHSEHMPLWSTYTWKQRRNIQWGSSLSRQEYLLSENRPLHRNQKVNTSRLLETLFWVRQSSWHPVQRLCTTLAFSERTLAWWVSQSELPMPKNCLVGISAHSINCCKWLHKYSGFVAIFNTSFYLRQPILPLSWWDS